MRKDLIIGFVTSILLHLGLFFGEDILHLKGKAPVQEHHEEEKIIQMVMPEEPPPETEEVHELQDQPQQQQLAPPSLVDLPSTVDVTALQQPVQPPPPPNLASAKGAVTIPVVKPGSNFGRGMKDLFNVGDLDQRPVPTYQPPPDFPYEMKRAGIKGTVDVEYIVDSNGNVVQVQPLKSSQREFEEPTIRALLRWKFRPGKKSGRAVNTRVQQEFSFNLSGD
ncbi:MAG TPA: energy transducer TonB [Candidatus Didemnitutus sp.]|nr:energy transducer TonB [Candidatus Didemnitutus sp.]